MTRNTSAAGGIEVEAGLIAEGLGLPVSQLKELIREGAITSRCERGVGHAHLVRNARAAGDSARGD